MYMSIFHALKRDADDMDCDWLFWHVGPNGLMGGPWPIKAAMNSRPSGRQDRNVWLLEMPYNHKHIQNMLKPLRLPLKLVTFQNTL